MEDDGEVVEANGERDAELDRWLDQTRRRWIGRMGIFGPVLSCIGASLQFYVYDTPTAGWTLLATGALFALLVPLASRTRRIHNAFHYMAIVFVGAIATISYLRGGFHLVLMVYLTVLPLGALVLRMQRVAVVWMGGVFAVAIGLFTLEALELTPPRVAADPFTMLFGVLLIVATLTIVGYRALGSIREWELRMRRAERALSQQRRLDSLGRLAGGVAHDFNNLLTIIRASAEESHDRLDPDSRQLILDAVERGAELTRSLVAAARDRQKIASESDASEVVRTTASLVRRVLPESIRLRWTAGDPVYVALGAGELGHALLNLCLNARDAMPAGGLLAIECRVVEVESSASVPVRHGALHRGRHARLTVIDEGVGMRPQEAARVFEPFETSKSTGSGLGLYRVRQLVEAAGGAISLESSPQRGTSISLYFPATAAPASSIRESRGASSASERARGLRVLLVEDDDGLRAAVSRMLRRAGVDVSTADDAEEALRLAATSSFDVLLTDVLMPGMSGPALASELLARGFRGRVVLMTGYARDELGTTDDYTVLAKPVGRDALLAALAGVGSDAERSETHDRRRRSSCPSDQPSG
jgi:signal transduction histidine kinase/ActR/RegA family two-component response regulator